MALATTSRGARSASSWTPCHEPVALPVHEERALAADGFGDQRLLAPGVRTEVHHGRVELHELEIPEAGAGPQCERHPVTGRHGRVGGLREHLPEPAAGEDDGRAPHRADSVALSLAEHVQSDSGDASVVGQQQVDGQRMGHDLDLGRRLDRRDQGPLDLGAGRVATRVRDPVPAVPALAGQRQGPLVLVEDRTPGDELADGVGPLVHQDPDRLAVTDPGTRDQGVLLVLLGSVTGAEGRGDPALGPLRRTRAEHVLGDHQDLVDLPVEAQRRGEAGDPGADDDDIGLGRPAGGRRRQTRGDHPRRLVVTACI